MDFWDILFPKKCINCGVWGGYICPSCEVGLWEAEQVCPVCNSPSYYGLTHKQCRAKDSLNGLVCFWAYEGLAKKIIRKSKYRHHLLNELVDRGVELVNNRPEFSKFRDFLGSNPTLVAAPNSEQDQVMAEALAKKWGLKVGQKQSIGNNTVLVGGVWDYKVKSLQTHNQKVWLVMLAR